MNWINLKVKLNSVICNLVEKKKEKDKEKKGAMSIRKEEDDYVKMGLDEW